MSSREGLPSKQRLRKENRILKEYIEKLRNVNQKLRIGVREVNEHWKESAKSVRNRFEEEMERVLGLHSQSLLDLQKLSKDHHVLVEEVFSKKNATIILAHDNTKSTGTLYQYTKTMTDYLFRSKEPLPGGLDFRKFQVCQFSPHLLRKKPDARFDVVLYFIMAAGGIRQAHIPRNVELFKDLMRRSDKLFIIACRNKVRFSTLEVVCREKENEMFKGKEGVTCLNFLMARGNIQENEHNTKCLRRIYHLLPEPVKLPSSWYERYIHLDVDKEVETIKNEQREKKIFEQATIIKTEEEEDIIVPDFEVSLSEEHEEEEITVPPPVLPTMELGQKMDEVVRSNRRIQEMMEVQKSMFDEFLKEKGWKMEEDVDGKKKLLETIRDLKLKLAEKDEHIKKLRILSEKFNMDRRVGELQGKRKKEYDDGDDDAEPNVPENRYRRKTDDGDDEPNVPENKYIRKDRGGGDPNPDGY